MTATDIRRTGDGRSVGMLLDSVDEAPAGLWPARSPTYATRQWLAASRWPGDNLRYLTTGDLLVPVRTVSRPRTWARMNLVDICAGTAYAAPADSVLLSAARTQAVPHLLVAAPGYYTVPIGSPGGDRAALVDAVEALADAGRLPAGFAYLPPGPESLTALLRERGYATGVVSATTTLPLPGGSFDDYLARLPRRRRAQVRWEIRRFERAGGEIRHFAGAAVGGQLPLVAELESELQRTHGFTADSRLYLDLNDGFLARFGPRMHVLRADLCGEPVATATLLQGGEDLVARALGARDRTQLRSAMVYFNLVYYASIGLAYRLGVRRMWFGPSTLDAKRWRGLRLVPLSAAVDPRRAAPLAALLAGTDAHLHRLLAPGMSETSGIFETSGSSRSDGPFRPDRASGADGTPGTDRTPEPTPPTAPAGIPTIDGMSR